MNRAGEERAFGHYDTATAGRRTGADGGPNGVGSDLLAALLRSVPGDIEAAVSELGRLDTRENYGHFFCGMEGRGCGAEMKTGAGRQRRAAEKNASSHAIRRVFPGSWEVKLAIQGAAVRLNLPLSDRC